MTVKKLLALVAFSATTMCAIASMERADFVTGEGTNGWTLSANEYVSPTYSSAVDSISLKYSGSGEGSATVYAAAHQNSATSQVATLTAVSSAATFDFSETTDFRSFKIKTSGDWSLASFVANVAAAFLAAPSNVVATAITTDSLEVSWDAVESAKGYAVSIWTNKIVGASNGTEVWADDFSKAVAGSTSAKAVDSSTFNVSYSDTTYWECNEYVYPSTTSGAIRIGASDRSKAGILMSPHLPGGDWHLQMRAWRHSKDDGTDMPIYRNSSGVTSLVQVVSFAKGPGEPEDFLIELPSLVEGDHLMFCSFTNKSPRVILDRVALVSGYSEGVSTPDVFREISVGAATSCTVENLPQSVPVFVGVTAAGSHGVSSAVSEGVAVDLAHPPPRALLNALPLSELADGVYLQDFDSLAEVTSTSGEKDWLNGTTLSYWQAYKNDNAATTFKYNGGGANSGGLYALATNQSYSVRALGAYSTQNDEFLFGIAFTNDTDAAIILTNVSYSAQQWGFKNTASQTLQVSAAVTDVLCWLPEYAGEWKEISSAQSSIFATDEPHDTPEVLVVIPSEALPISINPGQVLMLKWTMKSLTSGTPSMLAIDDLTVMFAEKPLATLIFLTSR